MQDAWALSEGIWCWPGWRRLLTLRLRSDDDYSCDLLSHLVDLKYQIYWSFYVREYPVGISRGSIVEGGTWAPIPVYGHGMSWAFVELKQSIVEERTWAPTFVHGHDMGWEFAELRENIVEKETWTPAPVHGHDIEWAIVELGRELVELGTWVAPIPVHWFGLDLDCAACKHWYYARRNPVWYRDVGRLGFAVANWRD